MDHLLTTATTKDERERASRVAVLPVGSFEQHGDYLPLATDTIIASVIAREIASAYGLMLLPPISISCSHEHAAWPGTVSISARTLHYLIGDIVRSAAQNGADRLLIVNGHGGNYVLSNIVQEMNVPGPQVALFPARDDWDKARQDAGMQTTTHEDMHGGELEVSILLHSYPDLVLEGYQDSDHNAPHRHLMLTLGMSEYTATGIIGRPSLGTAQKGASAISSLVQSVVSHLDAIKVE